MGPAFDSSRPSDSRRRTRVSLRPLVAQWAGHHLGADPRTTVHCPPRRHRPDSDSSPDGHRPVLRFPAQLVARRNADRVLHVHQRPGGHLHRETGRLQRGPGDEHAGLRERPRLGSKPTHSLTFALRERASLGMTRIQRGGDMKSKEENTASCDAVPL